MTLDITIFEAVILVAALGLAIWGRRQPMCWLLLIIIVLLVLWV